MSGIFVASATLLLCACGSASKVAPEASPSAAAASPDQTGASPAAATSQSGSATTAETAMTSPVSAPKAGDPIRSRGGLESKCLSAVAKAANNQQVSTNHIEESQASIEVYVNVQGAQAPWVCRGSRGGTVGEVSYSGSEGDL